MEDKRSPCINIINFKAEEEISALITLSQSLIYKLVIRPIHQMLTGEGSPESQFCLMNPVLGDKTGGIISVSLRMEQQAE